MLKKSVPLWFKMIIILICGTALSLLIENRFWKGLIIGFQGGIWLTMIIVVTVGKRLAKNAIDKIDQNISLKQNGLHKV